MVVVDAGSDVVVVTGCAVVLVRAAVEEAGVDAEVQAASRNASTAIRAVPRIGPPLHVFWQVNVARRSMVPGEHRGYGGLVAVVRRVRADDAEALRALRLTALSSDPDAFGSTYERETAKPAEKWVVRAESASDGPDEFIAVADADGRLVGMAGGYRPDEAPEDRIFWGLWVAPETRGHGLGARLVRAVATWAEQANAERLTLWVVTTNTPAVSLYRGLGFVETGRTQALPSNPDLTEIELTLPLAS